jgi:hypothetical protein
MRGQRDLFDRVPRRRRGNLRRQRNMLGRVQQLLGNMLSQFLWWYLPHKDL